jgi:3-hydroxyisobutyrate dehydrogenase-like beta-hydroxyacid dehydrogenase
MRIAVLGLGKMGAPMAQNLCKAGHQVAVWNRNPDKAAPLAASGARVAASPADAVRDVELALTMLADDAAVERTVEATDGLLDSLPAGAVHVSSSTISVTLSARLAALHAAKGQRYVAAPVFGRPDAAEAAKLFVVAAGAADAIDAAQPVFDAIGQRSFRVGAEPHQANVVKLCGNYLLVATVQTLGEAVALARGSGVEAAALIEVLTETLFGGVVHRGYGAAIARQHVRPAGFTLELTLKDVRLALEAARGAAVPMPVASLLQDATLTAVRRGYADADLAALARVTAENAGLS